MQGYPWYRAHSNIFEHACRAIHGTAQVQIFLNMSATIWIALHAGLSMVPDDQAEHRNARDYRHDGGGDGATDDVTSHLMRWYDDSQAD